MNGRLSDQPLTELVQEISDARLSGALRLARERARGAVYFDGGRVAAALSNVRAFRLVEVLRRSGAADPARLYALVGEKASDEQAGLVLMRAGVLDEAALRKAQERQSKEVLVELLRWTDGEWSFDPRVRLAGLQQGGHLEVGTLLAESARAFPHEFFATRMGDEERVAPAEGAQERVESGMQLRPAEAFILSRVYMPMSLAEVVAVGGLPAEEARRAVYVLALAGLLERSERQRAAWAEALRQAAVQQQQKRPAGKAPAQEEAAARQTAERERPPEPEPEPEAQGTVDELLTRARGANHYEVLGVARSATPEDVKRVYYAHARRLHPDRFRRDADEEQRQRIDAAFARIAQAYDTLKDTSLRAAYDLKLSKQGK